MACKRDHTDEMKSCRKKSKSWRTVCRVVHTADIWLSCGERLVVNGLGRLGKHSQPASFRTELICPGKFYQKVSDRSPAVIPGRSCGKLHGSSRFSRRAPQKVLPCRWLGSVSVEVDAPLGRAGCTVRHSPPEGATDRRNGLVGGENDGRKFRSVECEHCSRRMEGIRRS